MVSIAEGLYSVYHEHLVAELFPHRIEASLKKKPMWVPLVVDFAMGIVRGYILAHAGIAEGSIFDALTTAAWLWLGFIVPMEVCGEFNYCLFACRSIHITG